MRRHSSIAKASKKSSGSGSDGSCSSRKSRGALVRGFVATEHIVNHVAGLGELLVQQYHRPVPHMAILVPLFLRRVPELLLGHPELDPGPGPHPAPVLNGQGLWLPGLHDFPQAGHHAFTEGCEQLLESEIFQYGFNLCPFAMPLRALFVGVEERLP